MTSLRECSAEQEHCANYAARARVERAYDLQDFQSQKTKPSLRWK